MSAVPPPISLPSRRTSALAIWSLICGILTFICLGPIAGLAAVILGHCGLSAIKNSGNMLEGRGMAIAGLVMGYVGIALSLLILPALLLPAISGARDAAYKAKALNEARSIATAIKSYQVEYGKLPGAAAPQTDKTYAENNQLIFDILRAQPSAESENPKRITFLEGRPAKAEPKPKDGYDSQGVFLDPWGTPYFVRLDTNGDGQIEDPYTGEPVREPVIVWSYGRDGLPGNRGNKDGSKDVRSWSGLNY